MQFADKVLFPTTSVRTGVSQLTYGFPGVCHPKYLGIPILMVDYAV